MTNDKKISYSAYKKYVTCPKSYDYYYNECLRPMTTSSALVFGLAIDAALNALLTGSGDPIGVFKANFEWANMEGVIFDKKDLQEEVFSEEQLSHLSTFDDEYKRWACLRVKGVILLEAYQEQIFPMITEVHSVQKTLDSRPGVLDAVVSLNGYGLVLADHKTAGMPYKDDAIETDTQLALYALDQKIDQVAYIVMVKEIRFQKICSKCGRDGTGSNHKTCAVETAGVRCHGIFTRTPDKSKAIQLIVGKPPVINQGLIENAITDVEKQIKAGVYPRNLTACGNMYGKPCPYLNKCWKNLEEGLKYVPRK